MFFTCSVIVEARKLSDHTVSIGGRSLILDKNLYFLSVRILSFFLTTKLQYDMNLFSAASSVWELER